MKLCKEAIEEFRRIWKEEFGEEISYEQAEIRGKELIRLFNVIFARFPSAITTCVIKKGKKLLPRRER